MRTIFQGMRVTPQLAEWLREAAIPGISLAQYEGTVGFTARQCEIVWSYQDAIESLEQERAR